MLGSNISRYLQNVYVHPVIDKKTEMSADLRNHYQFLIDLFFTAHHFFGDYLKPKCISDSRRFLSVPKFARI